MLTNLQIKNFALIDNLDLELSDGMAVITGETGAGKSIMIDALELVLGGRAQTNLIRPGQSQCEINAVFNLADLPQVQQWLSEQEFIVNQECILRRIVKTDGRSKAYLNGSLVPLQVLKELAELLIAIHGQHAHQSLTKNHTQRQMLDAYAGLNSTVNQLHQFYEQYKELQKQIQLLSETSRDNSSAVNLLQYQIDEISALNLQEQELNQLHQQQKQLTHAQDRILTANQLSNLLQEDDNSIEHALQLCLQQIPHLRDTDNALANNIEEYLQTALIQIQEAYAELQNHVNAIEEDPQKLQEIEQRLNQIYQVAQKQQVASEQLPVHVVNLQQQLQQLQQQSQKIAQLEQQALEIKNTYLQQAKKIHQQRQQAAKKLSQAITKNMQKLGMQGGQFKLQVDWLDDANLHPYGMDKITFLVSANPGHSLAALNKIASGGELSRISLALQVIIAQHYKIPILIFDEVDVGIGGSVAETVGRLLRELGNNAQVLSITHLPQVASCAHHHLKVEKTKSKKQTKTQLLMLNHQQRIAEIARMLGGIEITDSTRIHAQEMLDRYQNVVTE